MATKLILQYVGRDNWDRPVYECDGKLYVDVEPRKNRPPAICTKQGNYAQGEPDHPIPTDTVVTFLPQRNVWNW